MMFSVDPVAKRPRGRPKKVPEAPPIVASSPQMKTEVSSSAPIKTE